MGVVVYGLMVGLGLVRDIINPQDGENMDPSACLVAALGCIYDGEDDLAWDCLNNYAEWRENGGFEPPYGDVNFSRYIDEYERKFEKVYDGKRLRTV